MVMGSLRGKERDAETGLDYFGARYFGGGMGRFTSPDPLMASAVPELPQSWNRYSYVLNNPLRYIDPTGEVWVPTGQSENPYVWSDTCHAEARCYDAVAVSTNNGVTVYGGRVDAECHLHVWRLRLRSGAALFDGQQRDGEELCV